MLRIRFYKQYLTFKNANIINCFVMVVRKIYNLMVKKLIVLMSFYNTK